MTIRECLSAHRDNGVAVDLEADVYERLPGNDVPTGELAIVAAVVSPTAPAPVRSPGRRLLPVLVGLVLGVGAAHGLTWRAADAAEPPTSSVVVHLPVDGAGEGAPVVAAPPSDPPSTRP